MIAASHAHTLTWPVAAIWIAAIVTLGGIFGAWKGD